MHFVHKINIWNDILRVAACVSNASLVARLHFQKVKSIYMHTTIIKDCFLFSRTHTTQNRHTHYTKDSHVCVHELNTKFPAPTHALKDA